MHSFLIFYVIKLQLNMKYFLLHTVEQRTRVIDLQAEIAVFIYGTPFLFERMTDRQTTIIQEVMADTFMKKNKVSGSFLGKQLIIFVPVIKSKFLWKKLEFWKTYISFSELNSFLIVKPFLMRLILTNVILKCCIMRCVLI